MIIGPGDVVLPERPVSIFPLVIFLRRSSGDNISAGIFHQEMNVVGCHHVVQYRETEPLLGFENPMQITSSIAYSESLEIHALSFS